MIYLVILLILALYIKTYKYNLLIDDPVPRKDYLYSGPKKVPVSFFEKRKSLISTIINIVVFISVCAYINIIWGWKAALLFAVMPLNVFGVAWNTGNYYMTTALFVLTGHYFLMYESNISALISACFYGAALNSTINSLSYVFIAPLFTPYGFVHVVPFLFFIFGKRFKAGLKVREEGHRKLGIKGGFEWKNLLFVPKVIAYYIYLSIWPAKLGLFHEYAKNEEFHKKSFLFASILVCISFCFITYMVAPIMCFWWFLSVGIFTHITGHKGQFVAERYTVLSNIAFCVILSKIIQSDVLLAVIATLWFCRSWLYIPSFSHVKTMFMDGIKNFPRCPENYVNLSSYYIENRNFKSALSPLLLAEKYSEGRKYGIYMNLANCYANQRAYDKAYYYTQIAMAQAPTEEANKLKEQLITLNRLNVQSSRLRKQLERI